MLWWVCLCVMADTERADFMLGEMGLGGEEILAIGDVSIHARLDISPCSTDLHLLLHFFVIESRG